MKLDHGAIGHLQDAWAKLEPRDHPQRWHSLIDHSHDVAACVQALLDLPIAASRLARLGGCAELPEVWRERLVVLAFLHDFGKANHAFQERRGGHIAEAEPLLLDADLAEPAGLTLLDDWFVDDGAAVHALAFVLTHHGAPPSERNGKALAYTREWRATGARDPVKTVRGLVEEARLRWPRAFAEDGETLSKEPAFWHAFLGLLQLGDWLGSDAARDAFPFSEEDDPPRHLRVPKVASYLTTTLGLDASALRRTMSSVTFEAIAGGAFEARPIQAAAATAEGSVVVLESETGSGKTEAALYRFAHLFQAGRVDGLYFALPTRLAATQMIGRVQKVVERLFPQPDTQPVVVRAIPGDAGADGRTVRSLPDFEVQWDDDPDALTRRRRWAAEGPKRFLAAPIAVGTIDQALLGAVKVKHAQMRSFCLSRSLLVVDEVHASDTYMATILGNLLEQHLRAGGEALLLSATLGAEARTRLLLGHMHGERRLAVEQPRFSDACEIPYPSISTVRDGRVTTTSYASTTSSKPVQMQPDSRIADVDALAAQALEAAQAGARVLMIRNTVGDAVATRQALERLAPDSSVQFRVAGVGTLHHSRFAREDRRRLDAEVENQFGRNAPRGSGLVLVGTQTLEISLDIDADLLIADLCPVDVLLQRIGRLHRHERVRPEGFAVARCVVLIPSGFDAALTAAKRGDIAGPHGHGTVYQDLLVLEATRRLLSDAAEWVIPEMNRALVERATHPEAIAELAESLSAEDPRWNDLVMARAGKGYAERSAADRILARWASPVWEFQPDEAAATRLGTKDVELRFVPELTGAFGAPVSRLVVPSHLNPAGAFEAEAITPTANGFTFRLDDRTFVYDGYGLRRMKAESGGG